MPKRDADHLDRKIDQISDQLPESAGAFLRWLRTPSSRWVRVPLAVLLIIGGFVGSPAGAGILDDSARPSVVGTGRALPPRTDIAVTDVAGAKMGQMEKAVFTTVVTKKA